MYKNTKRKIKFILDIKNLISKPIFLKSIKKNV